jgi:hypothetical protein
VLTDSIPQERFVPDAQRALAMMRGAVGAEAPSVMDPSRSAYDSAVSSTELADMLSNLVPGVGALKGGLSALKAGAGALPAMGGIIRRGGDPTLHLTHALSSQDPSEALQFIQQQKPTLTAPSVAISRHNPTPFGGNSPTLLMNPYSKVYDPRHNALYPRDAYTFRVKDAEQHLANPSKDVRLTEQAHPPESNRLAISTMPRFRSFEGYEKSPFGALNLGEFDEDASKLSKELTRDYQQWYYNKGHDLNIPNYAGTARLIKAAQLGDEEAQQILRGLRMLPSEYGELKVMRHVPVNRENVSAIMLPNDFQSTRAAKYKEQGERLGVPTGSFYELATPGIRSEIDERVALLGDAVRPFQSRILDLDITPTELRESLPPGVANSIDILALTQTATDPESIVKAIQFDTLKSRQNDILNALHVDPTQQYAEGGQVKTPRIPTRNTRFIDPEAETNRGMSALEALRGYFGAPSQASVMRPGMSSAYSGGELAGMAEMLVPGAGLAKGALGAALAGVIKPKGGNWLTGSVENALASLKRNPPRALDYDELQMLGEPTLDSSVALNKWIEGPLTKYIKRDMATMDDPVRKLAEEGVLHYRPGREFYRPDVNIDRVRNRGGFPAEGVGISDLARKWENVSDEMIHPNKVGKLRLRNALPDEDWVKKLDYESNMYSTLEPDYFRDSTGFPHLTDELSNALNPESGLPRNLLLRPEQMQQMGMEKAVRHVDAINKWRAAQKVAADQELANKGLIVREYAENNPKGLRWVELGKETPDLKKQLKYEGDTMGHCVGGYCPDVLEGRSRIFSLRDAKGEPHVTVEVNPQNDLELAEQAEDMAYDRLGSHDHPDFERVQDEIFNQLLSGGDFSIAQIKGKQNLAPKDDYLPFVQDFVRNSPLGGGWGRVGDLGNTGLQDISKFPKRVEALGSPYVTEKELTDYLDQFGENGMAEGGIVDYPNITPHAMLNRIVSAYNAL